MEGNRKQVEGKALGFAYEFDKEGRRTMVISFLPHKHFTGSPGPATQFMELVRNESLGHKSVGPFVKEILGI